MIIRQFPNGIGSINGDNSVAQYIVSANENASIKTNGGISTITINGADRATYIKNGEKGGWQNFGPIAPFATSMCKYTAIELVGLSSFDKIFFELGVLGSTGFGKPSKVSPEIVKPIQDAKPIQCLKVQDVNATPVTITGFKANRTYGSEGPLNAYGNISGIALEDINDVYLGAECVPGINKYSHAGGYAVYPNGADPVLLGSKATKYSISSVDSHQLAIGRAPVNLKDVGGNKLYNEDLDTTSFTTWTNDFMSWDVQSGAIEIKNTLTGVDIKSMPGNYVGAITASLEGSNDYYLTKTSPVTGDLNIFSEQLHCSLEIYADLYYNFITASIDNAQFGDIVPKNVGIYKNNDGVYSLIILNNTEHNGHYLPAMIAYYSYQTIAGVVVKHLSEQSFTTEYPTVVLPFEPVVSQIVPLANNATHLGGVNFTLLPNVADKYVLNNAITTQIDINLNVTYHFNGSATSINSNGTPGQVWGMLNASTQGWITLK